jgi:hypothetical protein
VEEVNTMTAGAVGMFVFAALIGLVMMAISAVRQLWASFFIFVWLTIVFGVGAAINIWWLITA